MMKNKETKPAPSLMEQLAGMEQKIDQFWRQTYPGFSPEQKLSYWIDNLRPAVEWERSRGGDPYALFSPENLALWQEQEPAFAGLLPAIADALNLDAGKIRKRN